MTARLKLVASSEVTPYPRSRDTLRPFRLWDARARAPLRWRYYKHKAHAHNGALVEARWAKVGTTIEVVDVRYGRMLGQYTRTVDSIAFLEA